MQPHFVVPWPITHPNTILAQTDLQPSLIPCVAAALHTDHSRIGKARSNRKQWGTVALLRRSGPVARHVSAAQFRAPVTNDALGIFALNLRDRSSDR